MKDDEIIKLLEKGYSADLIAFEFDIPEEQMKACQDELKQTQKDETKIKKEYSKLIERYKEEIENPKDTLDLINKRNLLAFAYFKAGETKKARNELTDIINKYNSCVSYRQLVHLEKANNNLEDAKLWAEYGVEYFPEDLNLRKQLLEFAQKENNQELANEQINAIEAIKAKKYIYKEKTEGR